MKTKLSIFAFFVLTILAPVKPLVIIAIMFIILDTAFGTNIVEPKNPKHAFAGHAITEEFPYEPQFLEDEA